MSRAEGEHRGKHAVAVPTGIEYTAQGPRTTYEVAGCDPEFTNQFTDFIRSSGGIVGGSEMSRVSRALRSRSSHGMPGIRRWNASWEPRGPENPPHNPNKGDQPPRGR